MATLATATVAACSGGQSEAGAAAISFALPSGASIDTVSYVVLSSGKDVLSSGTEDVRDPDATLSLTLTLPVGGADVLEVMAKTATGTSCNGSSQPFDVVAGRPTVVSLVLVCGTVAAGPDSCPLVTVVSPSPAQAVAPSGAIDVAATASDPDPGDVLSFAWAAGAGAFDDPTAAATRYLCTAVGTETLVLTVDDHHLPSSCTLTFLLPVTCLASGDPGS